MKNKIKKFLVKGNQDNRKSAGITLVALVITIIILLILAGISIAQLTGNGLFEKAKLAKEVSKNAQEYEQTEIAKYTNDIDMYVGSNRQGVDTSLLFETSNIVSTINLNEDYNKFKALIFLHSNNSNGDCSRSSIFPVDYINKLKQDNKRISLDGYSTAAVNLTITNNTCFTVYSYGGSNEDVFAIYGIK